jgi:hypothetical protein
MVTIEYLTWMLAIFLFAVASMLIAIQLFQKQIKNCITIIFAFILFAPLFTCIGYMIFLVIENVFGTIFPPPPTWKYIEFLII